jgi:hypothetical protein
MRSQVETLLVLNAISLKQFCFIQGLTLQIVGESSIKAIKLIEKLIIKNKIIAAIIVIVITFNIFKVFIFI